MVKLALALGLLVLLLALVQWRAAAQESAAEKAHPPLGDFVQVGNVSVHYQILGSGPDLVLIHGASGNQRDFTLGLAQDLAQRYRVILFDRPGLGWTGRLPGKAGPLRPGAESPAEQAALLQAAADQLDLDQPIVLGHSFGGAVALAWGLSRPDETRALVLVSAVSMPWPGGLGWTYQLTGSALGGALFVPLVTAFLPEEVVRDSIAEVFAPQSPPEGYASHLGVDLTLRRETIRANAQQVTRLRPHVVEMQKGYGQLRLPVEILHGTADTIVPPQVHAQKLVTHLPNAQLTLLPELGHMLHHSAPREVIGAIDRAAARAGLR